MLLPKTNKPGTIETLEEPCTRQLSKSQKRKRKKVQEEKAKRAEQEKVTGAHIISYMNCLVLIEIAGKADQP